MSIFNQPIDKNILKNFNTRQKLLSSSNRTPQELTFMSGNSVWVKLSSSINVDGLGDRLAKENVLEGGTLFNNRLKYGVGDSKFNAYSIQGNLTGIKPMPGIISLTIDNIGAQGSIRKALIYYKCFDVKQLDILETLYMRPGYTLLLEFGRSTYLDDNSLYQTSNEDFFNVTNKSILEYCNYLHDKSVKSQGNYDAMFGYVTNFSWDMEEDGSYNCITELISTGELLESIKLNYSLAGLIDYKSMDKDEAFKGLIIPKIQKAYSNVKYKTDYSRDINEEYTKNALGGIITELYLINYLSTAKEFKYTIPTDVPSSNITISSSDFTKLTYNSKSLNKLHENIDDNYFITLRLFIDIINKLILPHSISTNGSKIGPLTQMSVDDVNNIPLECLFNPLMTSVNPDVCLINNPKFLNIISNIDIQTKLVPVKLYPEDDLELNNPLAKECRAKIVHWIDEMIKIVKVWGNGYSNDKKIENEIKTYISTKLKDVKDVYSFIQHNYQIVRGGRLKTLNNPRYWKFMQTYSNMNNVLYLRDEFDKDDELMGQLFHQFNDNTDTNIFKILSNPNLNSQSLDLFLQNQAEIIETQVNDQKKINELDKNIQNYALKINKIQEKMLPFINGKNGIIGNIYINLKYLYNLIQDPSLASQDLTGNNSIPVTTYLKELIKNIQSSIGNVNDFEIHINDNTGRIVDFNYVNQNKQDTLHTFHISGKNSIVKKASLKSSISSEMSSMFAISAQGQAGKTGLENSTLLAFNKGITDRVIPKKDVPTYNNVEDNNKYNRNFISSLSYIFNNYYKPLLNDNTFNVSDSIPYKESLKNIINFSTVNFNVQNKSKSLLPVRIVLTLDGISGLIIGNIFNIDNDSIPDNYQIKGKKLSYVIVKIRSDLDVEWLTTIEAIPFIIDPVFSIDEIPLNMVIEYNPNSGKIKVTKGEEAKPIPLPKPKLTTLPKPTPTPTITTNPTVPKLLAPIPEPFYSPEPIVFAPTETTDPLSRNIVWCINFFKKEGFKPFQIAGILGNAMAESLMEPTRLNPNDKGKVSYGLFQWRGDRLENLKKYKGYSLLSTQLVFTIHESNYIGLKADLMVSTSIEEATFIWARYFEICDICFDRLAVLASPRLGYAKSIYETYLK